MHGGDPESLARRVIELCADCDQCRSFMEDTSCLFFPRLYRLYDQEQEQGKPATSAELKQLLDLCNMCGLCTCFNVRADIRHAKDAFVARDGLRPATLRILEDVQLLGKACGAFPRLANGLLENKITASALKRLGGIHPERRLPRFPPKSFAAWARKRGLNEKPSAQGRKVAYFAGCTAKYFFPEVAKATVEVLEHNGVAVHCPELKCCGMPSLLEGDRAFTLKLASSNLERLDALIEDGYDIVCSCPSCGYTLKNLFSEGAYLSEEYRAALRSEQEAGTPRKRSPASTGSERNKPPMPMALILSGMLKDESYFAALDGVKRINVAAHTYDLGEYLQGLYRSGDLNRDLGPVPGRSAYYPPCHTKEQNMGQPWCELLDLIPGFSMDKIGGAFDCCGMSGIMGFKREFHDASLRMGDRLMEMIKAVRPERLLSDCLSCRMQFNQRLPYEVYHPVEILQESYESFRS